MKKQFLISALVGGALALPFAAQARLIDAFNGTQQLIVCEGCGTYPLWNSAQSTPAASDIIGGYRDLWIAIDEPGTTSTLNAQVNVLGGYVSLSDDSLVESSMIIQWDGNDLAPDGTSGGVNPTPTTPNVATTGGFAAADLTDGGFNDHFTFKVISADAAFAFTLTVYEGASSVSFTGNSGAAIPSPTDFPIPMTAFAGGTATLADFDAVTAITLIIHTTGTDADFTIDRLDTGCSGRIGDFVWLDANENGIQDDGAASGIGGVTLQLYDGTGTVLLRTTATDANGFYLFPALCKGDYVVKVDASTLPAGVVATTSNAPGSTTANDSNGSPANVSLADDFFAEDLTIDFGYIRPAVCNSTINIKKYTNGVDADTAAEAPVVAVGSTVTWTYEVTTASAPPVPLQNIVVTDDAGTPGVPGDDFSPAPVLSGGYNVGDTSQDNLLDPGETWKYEETGTATLGLYENVATVTGDPEDERCEQVTDSDLSHYTGEALGTQGCTPGYWKQCQHFWAWTVPYTPSTLFSAVFENAFPGLTLLQVLELQGGGLEALGRHTVSALLNAAAANVAYPYTVQQVIDAFNAVYPGGDYEGLKDAFADANELFCPLDNGDEPASTCTTTTTKTKSTSTMSPKQKP